MRERGERGSAIPLVIASLALLLFLTAALGVVAGMVRAHRSAQSAADLSALAAAAGVAGDDPCATAAEIAEANAAQLLSCAVDGREVLVRVGVEGPRWLGQVADLEGEARAGPA